MADNARETVDPVRSRSDHRRAEGHQRQLRHLEALLSDGDTKECYAPETAKNDIADRHFKAEEYDPNQVHQKGKTAAPIYDLFSEREKGKTCKLEALQSDGNTDDGHTPQASGQHPRKSADQSAKQKPENIANHCHIPLPFRFFFSYCVQFAL